MAFNERQAFGEHPDLPPTTNNDSKGSAHTHGQVRVFTSAKGTSEVETEAQKG